MTWQHTSALAFLQGVPLQDLVAPYLLLRCTPRRISHPRPGMNDVVLAEVYSAPTTATYKDIFAALLAEGQAAFV